jgi:hypothetical protein
MRFLHRSAADSRANPSASCSEPPVRRVCVERVRGHRGSVSPARAERVFTSRVPGGDPELSAQQVTRPVTFDVARPQDGRPSQRLGAHATRIPAHVDPPLPVEVSTTAGARLGACASATRSSLGVRPVFGQAMDGRRSKDAIAVRALDDQTLRRCSYSLRRSVAASAAAGMRTSGGDPSCLRVARSVTRFRVLLVVGGGVGLAGHVRPERAIHRHALRVWSWGLRPVDPGRSTWTSRSLTVASTRGMFRDRAQSATVYPSGAWAYGRLPSRRLR